MSEEKKEITLEERMENLENIIAKMESGEGTLDESFALYKSGMEELAAANEMLDAVEKAMLVMNEEGGLEDF